MFSPHGSDLTSCSINYRVVVYYSTRWRLLEQRRTRTHYPLSFSSKNKDPFSLRPVPLTLCVQGFTLCQIIWLASRASKMSQIMRCDKLPEQARWGLPASKGSLAVSCKKSVFFWPILFDQDGSFSEALDVDSEKELGHYPDTRPHTWSIIHICSYLWI